MNLSRMLIFAATATGLTLSACNVKPPPPPSGYFGETATLEQLIAHVNENNAKLPKLWAREHFEATIVDRRKNRATHIDGYGNLLFTGPNQMKLTAKNEVADLFEMGSDGNRFWLHEMHDQIFWWGNDADAGGGGSDEVPVRPDMVMEILGIRPLDTFFLRPPVPVMRFNNAADAYMVDWQMPLADHWAVMKEIWFDRKTQLPERVLLFDEKGHVVLWAKLSKYGRVEIPSADANQWPTMATRYELNFPYTGTTMTFDLSDMILSHTVNGVGFPNAATYRMPDPVKLQDSGVRVIQINEDSGR